MMTLEIILLVMAAVGISEGVRLSKSVLLFADPVGPGWYLFFMSCLLFLCATTLLVRSFIRRKAGQQGISLSLLKGFAGRVMFLLFLYGVAITYLGYGIASTVFFVWAQRLFGERSWTRCAMIGVTIAGCFYLIFSSLANVPLPRGLSIN
jgi:ABC-type Fe3+-siderophore transport system permease subunit